MQLSKHLQDKLAQSLEGTVKFDSLHKSIYATDASVYRNIPLGVAFPKNTKDLVNLVQFAAEHNLALIPRAAGTSLAGQCVGNGLVVDVSKHLTQIIGFDEHLKTVTVQPGVVRDELNEFLKPFGLFFGPNTSTSNRCTIGGMVGNNSSGTTSIKYGVTRDKVLKLKTVLSDGGEAVFEAISKEQLHQKTREQTLEGQVYKTIYSTLKNSENRQEILNEFPNPDIHRRNNGYAIDSLLSFSEFGGNEPSLNLCKLLAGSEGTLAFITEITLQLDKLPPSKNIIIAAHFSSIAESMQAVVIAIKHNLYTCELMDKTILDCTKNNREQQHNRFFVEGDPKALLLFEFCTDCEELSLKLADDLISDLQKHQLGYAFPKLVNNDIQKALTLRKAGLGLLGNMVGDKKAVACIEDTAVSVKDLPAYIEAFSKLMAQYNQEAVYYAHAGAGELHLRPVLNLKKSKDVLLFREITLKTAQLVKKYGGSFSGEHGDGIVRSEFIPLMIGEKNYEILRQIKYACDPKNIFNPGKIIQPQAMDTHLRYKVERQEPEIDTILDFSDSLGILRVAEKCNGSGDCRKLPNAGGTMCPSYRATRNEKDTTRARANALREFLTNSSQQNKFNHKELYTVFELCLSCKACSSECPSNVDIAALKAEFLYQYFKENKLPLRSKLFANNIQFAKWGAKFPWVVNFLINLKPVKYLFGIAVKRSIPKLVQTTVLSWYAKNEWQFKKSTALKGELYLFVDEFTNYYDASIGIDAIKLLSNLGYFVHITQHDESGRSSISKGVLDKAKIHANNNVSFFKNKISPHTPLVGIEPSAVLTFKDEYLRLADDKKAAQQIAQNTFTFEEFFVQEIEKKNISAKQFTTQNETIKVHVHCHQKALSTTQSVLRALSIPLNYKVTAYNSGCCGMAGSFGFEKEHYKLSMQIGEDTLFPKINNTLNNTIIVATGTSCRHQIIDGTGRKTKHPITVLREALL
jgi:FAD/FMN-containing dehydrogenase/Fe-S oxidoreductase